MRRTDRRGEQNRSSPAAGLIRVLTLGACLGPSLAGLTAGCASGGAGDPATGHNTTGQTVTGEDATGRDATGQDATGGTPADGRSDSRLIRATPSTQDLPSEQDASRNTIRVKLPPGWVYSPKPPGGAGVVVTAKAGDGAAFATVLSERKADFVQYRDINDYAADVMRVSTRSSRLDTRQQTGPTEVRDGRKRVGVGYVVTGTLGGRRLTFWHTFIATPTRYNQLMTWCAPSRVETFAGDFRALARSIDETSD